MADERTVLAMKARELTRTRVVVGDRVDVTFDVAGEQPLHVERLLHDPATDPDLARRLALED